MLVCGQQFTDEIIDRIQATVDSEPTLSRRALSLEVCQWLDWKRPNGMPKEMSCRVALLKLHRKGALNLPDCSASRVSAAKRNGEPLPIGLEPVSCGLKELGNIELIRIDSPKTEASRLWTTLVGQHHYLGAGPLCGAQMRYLVKSSQRGWLGAFAFSAAAWRVKARDEWIGWSDAARRQNLERVVGNSRFLILPQVEVPNLASHLLSLCADRLPRDWMDRYGVEPVLLETFVEKARFKGTCYRAANWEHVGSTCGRGRQDRDRAFSLAVKDVYVFPLHNGARKALCREPASAVFEKEPDRSEEDCDWAEEEFGRADLGDKRLTKRLVSVARDFYARPQGTVPQACQTRSKTKAAYRFFEHPEITMEKVLESHRESTLNRIGGESVVLAVQDTTTLNYTAHPATENLGPIGYQLAKGIGLILHDTMAFNTEGTPLGLLDVQCWARDEKDFGKKKRRHKLPIEEKESYKWLVSFNKAAEAQRKLPKTTVVSVGDRESDIYELFELALREDGGPKLLVRASNNRCLREGQPHLWEQVLGEEVAGIQEVLVPRRGNQPSRTAKLEVRFAKVGLKAPSRKQSLGDIDLYAILAQETNPPDGTKALEWMLLTTCEVASFAQAVEKLKWYALRWGIEVYHRTLKSGCKIEERQLGHADRIETCLAIDMVVAWRIYHLTKLGREIPDVPCTVFFEDLEWKALCAYVNQNPTPPANPPTLGEAMRMVASLGGFLGRKCDGNPGTKSLWIGLQRLDDMAAMWKIITSNFVPHPQ